MSSPTLTIHYSMGSSILVICIVSVYSMSRVSGHTVGTGAAAGDVISYFDAYLPPGSKCGQQKPVTGWTVNFDRWRATDGTITNDAQFVNGVFTTPQPGVYHCCSSFRCKQNGYCDFAIVRNNGNDVRLGTAGTRNTGINSNGWSSH